MLLTNALVWKLRQAFANNYLVNIKLSKTQLHKTGQSGGFLEPLLKVGLHLMKNVLKLIAKSVYLLIYTFSKVF